jgi:hypothetical protein
VAVNVEEKMGKVAQHLSDMGWQESPVGLYHGPEGQMLLDVTDAFNAVQQPVDEDDDNAPYQPDDQTVATAFVMDGGYNKHLAFLVIGPSERVHNYICYFHSQNIH